MAMTTPPETLPSAYVEEFIGLLRSGEVSTREQVLRAKARLCRKHGMARVPANYELLERIPSEMRGRVEPILRNKPVRTISGVAPVAVMTSPSECPHGRCSYCPGGVLNNSPQSYTGSEPAALRAAMYEFDPFRQTHARLAQLTAIGHRTDKVDLIIMGGTFTARPWDYQQWFVRRCLDAMNGRESSDLRMAQDMNESAASRCVGMTVETRPDWFAGEHVDRSVKLGATKVELGVQVLDDVVLEGVKRGHTVADIIAATAFARNAGLKVCYHIMPGLPGSSKENDLRSFDMMFEDDRFRPDMLKIYPTLVVRGTELYDRWTSGAYHPLDLDDAVALVAEMKKRTPQWVRILRVQRDIPVQLIEAGVRKSHLREIVSDEMREDGVPCGCIRCREVGHRGLGAGTTEPSDAGLKEQSYRAGQGIEHFLSFLTGEGGLVGYARLRCSDDTQSEPARVRELHVYGELTPLDAAPTDAWQHRGFGECLLARCEEVASESGHRSISVTSGVGVRDYYRRLGYERDGMHMSKMLNER